MSQIETSCDITSIFGLTSVLTLSDQAHDMLHLISNTRTFKWLVRGPGLALLYRMNPLIYAPTFSSFFETQKSIASINTALSPTVIVWIFLLSLLMGSGADPITVARDLEFFPRRLHSESSVTPEFVSSYIQQRLTAQDKHFSFELSRAVMMAAQDFGFDPLLLLAVMETESRLRIGARGQHQEIGLMQIRPQTAHWLAKHLGWKKFDVKSLEKPEINVFLGAAYLNHLREQFPDHPYHFLSAYNMGPIRVRKLLAQNRTPKIYKSKVVSHYRLIKMEAASTSALLAQSN